MYFPYITNFCLKTTVIVKNTSKFSILQHVINLSFLLVPINNLKLGE